jgi:hypothetical protein
MLSNLRNGLTEDGRRANLSEEDKQASIAFWSERRLKVINALANCAISQKVC